MQSKWQRKWQKESGLTNAMGKRDKSDYGKQNRQIYSEQEQDQNNKCNGWGKMSLTARTGRESQTDRQLLRENEALRQDRWRITRLTGVMGRYTWD